MTTLLFSPVFFCRLLGLLALLVSCAVAPVRAQGPAFGQAIAVGTGSGSARASSTAADGQGNRYVAGDFQGTVSFGATTLTSWGNRDIFVAKLDAAGAYLWAVQAGGLTDDGAAALAVDATGGLYVGGSFTGPATFGAVLLGGISPTTLPNSDAFVGRLDAAGNWQWVRAGGSNSNDGMGSLVLDAAGNLYAGGSFAGLTAQFGPFSLANVDPRSVNVADLFIIKLDAAGNWRWAHGGGSGGYDWVTTLAPDGAGALFAYGSFEGNSLALGNLAISNSGSGSNDVYVAKLDTAGTWLWARDAGGTFIDLNGRMALDGAGNAYITGYFRSPSMGFGTLALPSHSGTSQLGELFVAKISGAGSWVWATRSGSALSNGTGIAVSATGEATLTGNFWGSSLQLGTTTLTNSSTGGSFYNSAPSDAFVARLDAAGSWLSAISSQGSGDEMGQTVAFDAAGNLVTTGFFQGTSATFGTTTLTGTAAEPRGYLTFVPGVPVLTIATLAPTTGAPGQTVTLTGSGFAGVTAVLFNGTPAASFAVQSTSRLTAVVPAGATAGVVSVRTAAGTGSSSTAFTPTVLATAPARASRLALSPNPATAQVLVAGFAAGHPVQLVDMLGRVARSTTVSAAGEVSVLGLAPGYYILRTTDTQGQQVAGHVVVE